jgi:hypothetical protein
VFKPLTVFKVTFPALQHYRHLKSIFPYIQKPPKYIFCDERKLQISHTRLRTNCSSLAEDLFSKNIIPSPLCVCGQRETTGHIFLDCPLYKNMINCISTYCHVSLNINLFGNTALTDLENEKIFLAVHKYIEKSNCFDTPTIINYH